jgi:hypothetical protein
MQHFISAYGYLAILLLMAAASMGHRPTRCPWDRASIGGKADMPSAHLGADRTTSPEGEQGRVLVARPSGPATSAGRRAT